MSRMCPKYKIGLFLSITLFAVCAQAQEATVSRFRQYHRVFAVERDKIDAACKKYPNSFRDGIIVATFVGFQPQAKGAVNSILEVGKEGGKGFLRDMRVSEKLLHKTARQHVPYQQGPAID